MENNRVLCSDASQSCAQALYENAFEEAKKNGFNLCLTNISPENGFLKNITGVEYTYRTDIAGISDIEQFLKKQFSGKTLNTLKRKIKGADLVITGEGAMDSQTFSGKSSFGVAILAKKLGIPSLRGVDNKKETFTWQL